MRSLRTSFIGCLLLATFLANGCATSGHPQYPELVSQLQGMAVVVDATVVHKRSLKPAILNTAENQAITEKLNDLVAMIMEKKGYNIEKTYQTVGLTSLGQIDMEISHDSADTENTFEDAPFVLIPQASEVNRLQLTQLQKESTQSKLSPELNPFGQAVLVINASGFYISTGAVAGNVAKGAINVVAGIGAAMGGSSVDFIELDKDTIILSVQLFDPKTGDLLWKDYARVNGNPDALGFLKNLTHLLEKLPNKAS
ncbi:MAG: hypothetical protein OEY67_06545 [Gammaproteobacteria bacterium]|nr:hypothetical protein [Gammaproteobacteria bacterium]